MLKISVPATSANLGPGFDLVGLALELHNEFYIYEPGEYLHAAEAVEAVEAAGAVRLSERSLFQRAFNLLAKKKNRKIPPLAVMIKQNVPRSRGLGSSATLTVGGLVAANVLLKAGLDEYELIELAAGLEGHPDNAAPALLGGMVVNMKTPSGFKYIRIMPKNPLQAVLAVPEFELSTSLARKVIPRNVPFEDAVQNMGRFGFFLAAMLTGDYSLLAASMDDLLHQPYRLRLVPGLREVMKAAVDAGALGSCLSGAGPSVLAFVDRPIPTVAIEMEKAWMSVGIKAEARVLDIAREGASWLDGVPNTV